MAIAWTPEMDAALMVLRDTYPDYTWAAIARELTGKLGQPISEDMARNRHDRIIEARRLGQVATPPPNLIEVPPNPEGTAIGFNVAFWDLETTSLGAWTGDLLVGSIVDQYGKTTTRDRFDFPQEGPLDQKGLAVWIRNELEKYDIAVAWNGLNFDIGFLNAKLTFYGERPLRRMLHIDPMFKMRGGRYGMRVGSSKLKNVALYFNTPNQKPDVAPEVWRRADHGDREALDELRTRCEADCLVMRDIFPYAKPYITTIHA